MTKGAQLADKIRENPHKTAQELAHECECNVGHVRNIARSLKIRLGRGRGRIITAVQNLTALDPIVVIRTLNALAGRVPTAQLLTALISPDAPVTPQVVDKHCHGRFKVNDEFKRKLRAALIKLGQTEFVEKYL